jgi:hypothetical protein
MLSVRSSKIDDEADQIDFWGVLHFTYHDLEPWKNIMTNEY